MYPRPGTAGNLMGADSFMILVEMILFIIYARIFEQLLTFVVVSSYEPELFPGLIYRMVKPKIVLLVFVSGKVVLTGDR